MKLTMKSTGNSPEYYEFSGDTVTAHLDGQSESFDLSGLGSADQFQGVEPETLTLSPAHIIRDAYRDDSGELHVTLCQAVGPGDWGESQEFDSSDYAPDAIQVPFLGESAGRSYAVTRRGRVNPMTGEVL